MHFKKLVVGFILMLYLISLTSGAIQNSQAEKSGDSELSSEEGGLWTNLKHKISELIGELSGKAHNLPNSTASTLAVMGILLILPVGMVLKGKSMKPREWVNKHREELKKKFSGKTILVCGNEVVKVFDGPVNPLKINEEARKLCKKEWCYTYLPEAEEEYLL